MKSDHIIALELAKLLDSLKGSSVEKYRYFYNRDPNCKYTKTSMKIFKREKDKLLKQVKEICSELLEV